MPNQSKPLGADDRAAAMQTAAAGPVVNAAKRLSSAGFTLEEFSTYMALVLPILYAALALLDIATFGSPFLGVLLYLVFLAFVMLAMFGFYLDAEKDFGKANRDEIEVVAALLLVLSVAVVVSFSQLCRHAEGAFGGFASQRGGYWHWLRFGIANFLESVLLDVPAIYEWNISEIKPTEFWSKGLLFIYRTSLELLVVAMLLACAKPVWRYWARSPKRQHSNYFRFLFPGIGRLVVLVLWLAPSAIFVTALVKDRLAWETMWGALRFGVPVTFGAWLSWQSLRALGVPGKLNKLWAILGMAAGAALTYFMWPMLHSHLGH